MIFDSPMITTQKEHIMVTKNAKPVADDDVVEADDLVMDTDDQDEDTDEGDEDEAEDTFSAKDLASELGIDPKSFRRWLRAHTAERANKGGRWVFTAESKAAFLDAYRSKDAKGTEPKLEELAEEAHEVPADADS